MLCFFEAQEDAAQLNFVVIVQRRRGFAGELLPIKECEVGAVLVFKHVLAIFDEDAGMHA